MTIFKNSHLCVVVTAMLATTIGLSKATSIQYYKRGNRRLLNESGPFIFLFVYPVRPPQNMSSDDRPETRSIFVPCSINVPLMIYWLITYCSLRLSLFPILQKCRQKLKAEIFLLNKLQFLLFFHPLSILCQRAQKEK